MSTARMGIEVRGAGATSRAVPSTLLAVALVVIALVLQVGAVSRLPLPGGVVPDLVLVTVAAVALRTDPLRGCVIGFWAGLAADVIPPAYHTIGRYALIYCAVGYLVAVAGSEVDDSPPLSFFVVALGALGGSLLDVGFGAIFSDPRVTWPAIVRIVPISVLYDVVVSPFVLYVVAKLVRPYAPANPGPRRFRVRRRSL